MGSKSFGYNKDLHLEYRAS